VSRTGPHAGLLTSSLAILATADRNHIKEKTMRFMLIVYPKIYETAQAGWLPDLDDESAENYAEELQKAGVLVALTGLTPPATMSARLTVENGMMKVVDGPFPEAKEVIGGIWIIDVQSRDEALNTPRASRARAVKRLKCAGCSTHPTSALKCKRSSPKPAPRWAHCKRTALRRGAPPSYRALRLA
jgi:hypothetical protein